MHADCPPFPKAECVWRQNTERAAWRRGSRKNRSLAGPFLFAFIVKERAPIPSLLDALYWGLVVALTVIRYIAVLLAWYGNWAALLQEIKECSFIGSETNVVPGFPGKML